MNTILRYTRLPRNLYILNQNRLQCSKNYKKIIIIRKDRKIIECQNRHSTIIQQLEPIEPQAAVRIDHGAYDRAQTNQGLEHRGLVHVQLPFVSHRGYYDSVLGQEAGAHAVEEADV